MNYTGVIIEESLHDSSILKDLKVVKTEIEPVKESHKTPWIKQWTLHTVEIPDDQAQNIADRISHALDPDHHWYADFKNDRYHFIIFRNRVFKVDRTKAADYQAVTDYGVSLGIPDYQLNFTEYIISS